jgi:hypothetical protein
VFLYELHTQFFTPHVLQQEELSAVCFCTNCTSNSSPHMFCSKRSCSLWLFVYTNLAVSNLAVHPTCFAARGAVYCVCALQVKHGQHGGILPGEAWKVGVYFCIIAYCCSKAIPWAAVCIS